MSAYRDLRQFLASRAPYELGFLVLALCITGVLVYVFARDSRVEAPYVPHVIYVKSWRLDRSDTDIKAQQVVDEAARKQRVAAQDAERAKTRAEFQRLDTALSNMGI